MSNVRECFGCGRPLDDENKAFKCLTCKPPAFHKDSYRIELYRQLDGSLFGASVHAADGDFYCLASWDCDNGLFPALQLLQDWILEKENTRLAQRVAGR